MIRRWLRRFAVRGIFWRHYLDFGVSNVPFYLQPIIIFFWTIFFYFFAAPARRAPSTVNVACQTRSTRPGLGGYIRSPPGSGRPAQASSSTR